MSARKITFYTTLGCHLCDQALEMLKSLEREGLVAVTEVDIADDDELVEAYGVRIPVLRRRDDGLELGWPFGIKEIKRFLE